MHHLQLNHLLLIEIPRKVLLEGCFQIDRCQIEIYVTNGNIIPLLKELQDLPKVKTTFLGIDEFTATEEHENTISQQPSDEKRFILTIELINNIHDGSSFCHYSSRVLVTIFWTGKESNASELKTLLKRQWKVSIQ